ncbi:MAG: UDP-3-O-[3-hydroxymyristoyl] N-acetylglucosamine deacetylase [Deltaproteobacteria bacterium SG8_13]|nr:MAG: UDP-3-O-[3-hydroxymyristoyl] N-acetylglucosamine deacetylase [Deltaproteobacteria bacterium SG8_13]
MHFEQRTVKKPVRCAGVGLHSGKKVRMTILPAPVNHGIKFRRVDLPGTPDVTAQFNRVVDTSLATVIGSDGCIVSTIEHLMATFAGLSIDNALVELDAYEVPVMDGSAGPFTRMIVEAGIQNQEVARHYFVLRDKIELREGEKSVTVHPADSFRITCSIEFKNPLIGKQDFDLDVTDEAFASEISNARTFGFLHEVEYLKRYGLAQGGSLDNAVVIDKDQIVNQDGLRYPDEFVRHKVLDCLGDFSLLGMPILGHLIVSRSGHQFNHAFLERFFSQKALWETRAVPRQNGLSLDSPKSVAN